MTKKKSEKPVKEKGDQSPLIVEHRNRLLQAISLYGEESKQAQKQRDLLKEFEG
jgi:hypothetical protein